MRPDLVWVCEAVLKSCSTHGKGLTSMFLIKALEKQEQEPAQEPLAAIWVIRWPEKNTTHIYHKSCHSIPSFQFEHGTGRWLEN